MLTANLFVTASNARKKREVAARRARERDKKVEKMTIFFTADHTYMNVYESLTHASSEDL